MTNNLNRDAGHMGGNLVRGPAGTRAHGARIGSVDPGQESMGLVASLKHHQHLHRFRPAACAPGQFPRPTEAGHNRPNPSPALP